MKNLAFYFFLIFALAANPMPAQQLFIPVAENNNVVATSVRAGLDTLLEKHCISSGNLGKTMQSNLSSIEIPPGTDLFAMTIPVGQSQEYDMWCLSTSQPSTYKIITTLNPAYFSLSNAKIYLIALYNNYLVYDVFFTITVASNAPANVFHNVIIATELYNSSGSKIGGYTRTNLQLTTTDQAKAIADFIATPLSGTLPLSVSFTDLTTGTVTGWQWDFGDGNSSVERNPQHTYTQAGIFSVKLTVTGASGADDTTRTNYITVTAPPPPQITRKVPLSTGWNLISWNVDASNDSAKVILKNIEPKLIVALGFQNGGLTYDPKLPQLSTLSLMDHLHGYWLKMTDSDTLQISGTEIIPDQTPIVCAAGWNLVSYLPDQPDSTAHGFSSIMDVLDVVLGYHGMGQTFVPALRSFSTLDVLVPNRGFWVKVSKQVNLLFPVPLSGIEPNQSEASILASLHKPNTMDVSQFLNPSREWINLYGQNITFKGNLLAVGTEVKATDLDGNSCGSFIVKNAGELGFMPVYRDDPHSDVDEGANPGEEIILYFGDTQVPVTLSWTQMGDIINVNAQLTGLKQDENRQPGSFALMQNHPNPFNPATKISFQLPHDGYVSLKVHNMLGQEIITLVDQQSQAGDHHAIWNGTDTQGNRVPSGIYLYKLKAGEYEATKKMLLLY